MIRKLQEKDLMVLERLFVEAKGRGFEPANRRGAALMRAIQAGYLKRADADFFSDRAKNSHVIFTDQGKAALVRRLAARYGLDTDDAHHLVRVGSYPFANTVPRREPSPARENDFESSELLPFIPEYRPRM